MTPRTFWAILIKILGIYTLLESVIAIPQFLSNIYYLASLSNGPDRNSGSLMVVVYITITLGLSVLVLWYCLFKTDWIIDKLKLDNGFQDERFEFNIHRSTILKIIIIIMGGLFLIDSFPLLCKDFFDCFQKTDEYGGYIKNPESTYVLLYFIKTLIGYFMLTCSRMIVNFIELKRKRPVVMSEN
jgi:hypothetical protein